MKEGEATAKVEASDEGNFVASNSNLGQPKKVWFIGLC
jgi:hypothetical protein